MATYYENTLLNKIEFDGYNIQQMYLDNVLVFGHHFWTIFKPFYFRTRSGINLHPTDTEFPDTPELTYIGDPLGFPCGVYPAPRQPYSNGEWIGDNFLEFSTQVVEMYYPSACESFEMNADSYHTFHNVWSSTNQGDELYDMLDMNNVVSAHSTFRNCFVLNKEPIMGNKITNMSYMYYRCYNLRGKALFSRSVINATLAYAYCNNIYNTEDIPYGAVNLSGTFRNDYNLQRVPIIPDTVESMFQTFYYCNSLHTGLNDDKLVKIGGNVRDISTSYAYSTASISYWDDVTYQEGFHSASIPNSVENMDSAFRDMPYVGWYPICGPNVKTAVAAYMNSNVNRFLGNEYEADYNWSSLYNMRSMFKRTVVNNDRKLSGSLWLILNVDSNIVPNSYLNAIEAFSGSILPNSTDVERILHIHTIPPQEGRTTWFEYFRDRFPEIVGISESTLDWTNTKWKYDNVNKQMTSNAFPNVILHYDSSLPVITNINLRNFSARDEVGGENLVERVIINNNS